MPFSLGSSSVLPACSLLLRLSYGLENPVVVSSSGVDSEHYVLFQNAVEGFVLIAFDKNETKQVQTQLLRHLDSTIKSTDT
jgi:hypothetical protein